MQVLLKSEFSINWATLVSLIVGMGLGIILFVLIYTLITINKMSDKRFTLRDVNSTVPYDEIKFEIQKAQKEFLEKKAEEKAIKFDFIRDIIIKLIKSIAKKFYPDSIEPIAELTLEEIIILDRYIVNKIEELLDNRGFKPLQKVKISTIIKIINAKNTVENNKVVKGIQKSGVSKIVSGAYTVLNAINPVVWVKKLIINPSINLITKQIILKLIQQIGQETYNVYSKQAFVDQDADEDIDAIIRNYETKENDTIKAK